jgi:hypothetical protein
VRNRVSAVALWFAATVLATTAVWLGTGAIGEAARSDTDLVVAVTTTVDPAVPGGSTTTAPDPATSLDPTTTPTSANSATVAPPVTRPAPTAAPPTTRPAPGPPTVVPALPVLGETRTYVLTGGTVTVRFAPDAVTVVLATPNPGFGVDAEQRGAVAIRVEFDSEQHRSRLDASWNGGPVDEVREEG